MNSVIGWVGGKRLLRKAIVPLIPKHDTHGECEARIHYFEQARSLNLPDRRQDSRLSAFAITANPLLARRGYSSPRVATTRNGRP